MPYWFIVVPGLTGEILEYSDVKVVAWQDRVLNALAEIETKIQSDGGDSDPFQPQTVTCGVVTVKFDPPDSSYPVPPLQPFNRQMARFWIRRFRTLTLNYGPKAIISADILIDNLPAIRFSMVFARTTGIETSKREIQSNASALAIPYTNATSIGDVPWPPVPFHVDIESPLSMTFIEYNDTAIANQELALTSIFEIGTIVKRSGFNPSDPVHTHQFTAGNVVISFIDTGFASPQKCTREQAAMVVVAVYALSCYHGPKRIPSAYIMIEGMTVLEFRLEVKDGTREIESS